MVQQSSQRLLKQLQKISSLICIVLIVGMSSGVYYFLDRGLSFADEGMYLYAISHPNWLWTVSTDFGSFLNPIFMALGMDIYAFRVATFFALLVMSFVCVASFFAVVSRHLKVNITIWCALCFALWGSVLAYYMSWLPTASYNTLALIGAMGILSALNIYTVAIRPYHPKHILAQQYLRNTLRITCLALLAFFGVIAFLGKPSTSAGMGIIAAFALCCAKGTRPFKKRLCDTALAGALALGILALYILTFHDYAVFFEKIYRGLGFFDKSYSLFNVLSFYAQYIFPTSYVMVFVTWPLWGAILWLTHTKKYSLALIVLVLTMCVWFVTSYFWVRSYTVGLMLFPLTVTLMTALYVWRSSWKHFSYALSLAVPFFCAALMYHAGTNTPLSYKISEGLTLYTIALASLCVGMKPERRVIVMPFLALIVSCATMGTLFYAFFEPTRHKGITLWDMTEPVTIRHNTRPLLVHPEQEALTDWILTTSREHGWQAGMPLILMKFDAASTLFLLDAFKVDGVWQTFPRYVADTYYEKTFSYVSPKILRQAWIMKPVEDGDRNMPQAVLPQIGLPFPEGYILLGTSPAESVRGTWPADQYEIWKPRNEQVK